MIEEIFWQPFKDKHSHLPYGAMNGPPGWSLQFYLPIKDVLKLDYLIFEVKSLSEILDKKNV